MGIAIEAASKVADVVMIATMATAAVETSIMVGGVEALTAADMAADMAAASTRGRCRS